MVMAGQFKGSGIEFDYEAFTRGFKEYYEDTSVVPFEDAMDRAQAAYMAAASAQVERMGAEAAAFLAENARKDGVVTTDSGLQYELITEGDGDKPAPEATVRVHYEGSLTDGTVFDSSYRRGEPIEFQLNEVIPGWSEGLQLMNQGSTYRLYIPSDLGYGEQGNQVIPPNAVLIFEVELLEILE
jgi:FKBP-type peptidyl-prolyl cis-trans isomerase